MKTRHNWKMIKDEVTKNIAYIATRRKEVLNDESRYTRMMAVDGDDCLLRRFYTEALHEADRALSVTYTADCRRQALIDYEVIRYVIAAVTAQWLHTVAPEESDYYDLLSARLLDHVCELAYRRRSNRPVRRRMRPF